VACRTEARNDGAKQPTSSFHGTNRQSGIFWCRLRLAAEIGWEWSIGVPEVRPHRTRQSAALPVDGSGESLRVVLITSRETKRWVIPKGWVEHAEPPHASAAREAFEEAGLEGEVEAEPLGSYEYSKGLSSGECVVMEVMVYRFRVARMLRDWPERKQRKRRLFTPEAAAALVAEPGLAALLRGLRKG
jgi:8-oxo-dGTP pyrophosphatase MutT (NUDIX family)